ncbi:MAG: serine hydrolase [Acidobacteria bacterium]|nr:serine hydrolase [Acidobacteriota bacterium]
MFKAKGRMFVLVVVGFVVIAPVVSAQQDKQANREGTPDSSITTRVDKIFEKWDKSDSPGCAVGVIREGRIVYKRGYGMADLEHRIPITPSTVFDLGSVSKQFTAAAVVLLAQQNKLSLDDNVRKYVPELPDFGAPITLRHLIHHTSGLREFWPGGAVVRDDVLDMAAGLKKLNFTPGEKYLYCDVGYSLLAVVIERVSGRSLREFARTEIFEPLGMKNTFFLDNLNEIVENSARSYEPRPGSGFQRLFSAPALPGASRIPGAGWLHSTVEDMALWDRNFYQDRVGRLGLVEQLQERGRLNNGEQLDYAFGLAVGEYRGLRVVEHWGEGDGYRAHFIRFPEQRFSVVMLCNAGEAADFPTGERVADVYLENEFQKPPPSAPVEKAEVVQLPREHLENKVGLYWYPERLRRHRIFLKDGKLFLLRPDDMPPGPYELEALSENRFRAVQVASLELRFELTKTGAPARLFTQIAPGPIWVWEPIEELAPTRDELAEYAGAYLGDEVDLLFRVRADGDKLVLSRLGSGRATLDPVFRDTFKAPYGYLDNWYLQFQRDSSGRVRGVVFSNIRNRDFYFGKLGTQSKEEH